MDIKERIDGLSEDEAKAALKWCVLQIAMYQTAAWKKELDMDAMQKFILCEALRRARK